MHRKDISSPSALYCSIGTLCLLSSPLKTSEAGQSQTGYVKIEIITTIYRCGIPEISSQLSPMTLKLNIVLKLVKSVYCLAQFFAQHVYKTVPMSSVMFTVPAMLPSIIFLIIFFVFTMPYFIMLLTTPQFPPRGLINFLSIQDLAYP